MENNPTRSGRITASRAKDLMTSGRGKDQLFGETAKTYALQLALEQLGIETSSITGFDIETWQMEWGNQYEPDARQVYEQSRGITCDLPGFITGPRNTGCTPDGMIADGSGLLEIKCPQWSNHTKYLLSGPPKEYIMQTQFQIMVTGADWCDFMTYHPEFEGKLRAKVFRIERDDEMIAKMWARLEPFNELIEEYKNQFSSL